MGKVGPVGILNSKVLVDRCVQATAASRCCVTQLASSVGRGSGGGICAVGRVWVETSDSSH